jgi:hypothetical protein
MTKFRSIDDNEELKFIKSGSYEEMILRRLIEIEHVFDAKKKMTKDVKAAIVNLGHDLGHKVYARIFTKEQWSQANDKSVQEIVGRKKTEFKNKEWLYDVHWYRDIDNKDNDSALHYIPTTFELACECEWSKNEAKSIKQNKKDIGYDFQKLLFSNAKLNLFICRCYRDHEMKELCEYFIKAVQTFNCLRTGARFLIVCFCGNGLYYLKFKKY